MRSVACWSDGAGLWLTTTWPADEVAALRRDPRCAVWIGNPGARASVSEPAGWDLPADAGIAIDGSVRIYDLSDPVRLALHAPVISAALTALALAHRSAIAGYVRDLPRVAGTWVAPPRALMRVRINRARRRMVPQHVTGMGPVLPTELPSGVRRALAGVRHVVLALQRGDGLEVRPAVWKAGFQLDIGAGVVPDTDTPACIMVDRHVDARPASSIGLLLRGTVDTRFRFRPLTATWWQGVSVESSALREPATASGIVLPD
jgi:hypothetical protein